MISSLETIEFILQILNLCFTRLDYAPDNFECYASMEQRKLQTCTVAGPNLRTCRLSPQTYPFRLLMPCFRPRRPYFLSVHFTLWLALLLSPTEQLTASSQPWLGFLAAALCSAFIVAPEIDHFVMIVLPNLALEAPTLRQRPSSSFSVLVQFSAWA